MKTCTKCKQEKGLEQFSKDSSRADSLCPSCKQCQRKYYLSRRGVVLERSRERRLNNPERARELQARIPRDVKRLSAKQYRDQNKEYFAEKSRERRLRQQLETLTMATRQKKRWTEQEDFFLLCSDLPPKDIAMALERTLHSVRHRKRFLAQQHIAY
jgi:hypothetical protein